VSVDKDGVTSSYARFALCFFASLVPSAPVGLYMSAVFSGAFIRSESISVFGLWMGVGIGTVIAAPLFQLFMKIGKPDVSLDPVVVALVALVSAVCLSLLGMVAAATDWLNSYGAGMVWLAAMLTLGSRPFLDGQRS
jgi:tellurite resistance protein TehA-like permease